MQELPEPDSHQRKTASSKSKPRKPNTDPGRIPIDSLLQIWSRLPTPSLYRFRSVCHLWKSAISSDPLLPSLRHRLPLSPPLPPTLLLILRHSPSDPVKHPDRPAHLSTRPASSILLRPDADSPVPTHPISNGFTPYTDTNLQVIPNSDLSSPLVCFCSELYFYLCNPSINQFYRLPQGQFGNSTSNAGFGYFGGENRYGLVNVSGTKVEKFEFGPGQAGKTQWKRIDCDSPVPVRGFGLMVDGRFFWTVADGLGFAVCLDYKEETFSLISPPEGNAGEVMLYDQMYLVEFKGNVCAVDNFSRPPRMEIWVLMNRNKNESEVDVDVDVNDGGFYWVRKYNVLMTGMDRDVVYPFCDYYFYDENDSDEGKIKEKNEIIVLCNGTKSRLYCYYLKSRRIKHVYKPKQRSFEQLALYTPGLFPLTIE